MQQAALTCAQSEARLICGHETAYPGYLRLDLARKPRNSLFSLLSTEVKSLEAFVARLDAGDI